jgi:hypothetical protein
MRGACRATHRFLKPLEVFVGRLLRIITAPSTSAGAKASWAPFAAIAATVTGLGVGEGSEKTGRRNRGRNQRRWYPGVRSAEVEGPRACEPHAGLTAGRGGGEGGTAAGGRNKNNKEEM